MPRTAADRLRIVLAVDALPTVQAKRARLARSHVSWGSYIRWSQLYREGGEDALATGAVGRPRTGGLADVRARVDALEARVRDLEQARE
jgi:hypothetical protein